MSKQPITIAVHHRRRESECTGGHAGLQQLSAAQTSAESRGLAPWLFSSHNLSLFYRVRLTHSHQSKVCDAGRPRLDVALFRESPRPALGEGTSPLRLRT